MCEVLRSPTLEMSRHPLQLRQPAQTTVQPSPQSPSSSKRVIPSLDMFAIPVKCPEPIDVARKGMQEESDSGKMLPGDSMLKYKGRLTMLAPGGKRATKLPVVLSVYCTPFDKYAVISQERVMCKDCGYVNLKTSHVRTGVGCSFQISTYDGEKQPLVFYTASEEELAKWVSVLEPCTDASQPIMVPKAGAFLPGSPRSSGFLTGSPRSHSKASMSLTALNEEEEEECEE